jgi:hypothetical protein
VLNYLVSGAGRPLTMPIMVAAGIGFLMPPATGLGVPDLADRLGLVVHAEGLHGAHVRGLAVKGNT